MKKRSWKMESAKWAAGFRDGIMMGMVFRVSFKKCRGRKVNQAGRPFQAEARA